MCTAQLLGHLPSMLKLGLRNGNFTDTSLQGFSCPLQCPFLGTVLLLWSSWWFNLVLYCFDAGRWKVTCSLYEASGSEGSIISVHGKWAWQLCLAGSVTVVFHSSSSGSLAARFSFLCSCHSWGLCAKSVFSLPCASSCSFWQPSHDWSSHAFRAWHMIVCKKTHSF